MCLKTKLFFSLYTKYPSSFNLKKLTNRKLKRKGTGKILILRKSRYSEENASLCLTIIVVKLNFSTYQMTLLHVHVFPSLAQKYYLYCNKVMFGNAFGGVFSLRRTPPPPLFSPPFSKKKAA